MNKALKTTAFVLVFFLTFLAFTTKSYAQSIGSNCREFYGNYYISDEFYRVCSIYAMSPASCSGLGSISAYSTESACNNASIQKYGCTPALANSVFYATSTSGTINYSSNTTSLSDALSCLDSVQKNETSNLPFCQNTTKFFQCNCSKTLVGEAGAIGTVISWISGADTYSCYLKPVLGKNLAKLSPANVDSPLALIKSVAEVLLYVAILIFIVNILQAGLLYIQSEGSSDELKKGRTILTNTLSGMIFFLLVSGLINYLTQAFGF